MRALIFALAALPACTLYEPNDGDDYAYWPDAGRWQIDARYQPDAQPDECAVKLPCPSSSTNRFTVCDRIYDVETGLGVSDSALTLGLTFYDSLAFIEDPMTATPLASEGVTIDECGRFTARNITVSASTQLAIVVDDAVNAPDNHRATMVTTYAWPGGTQDQQPIYSLRRSTDEAWASQVNLVDSFADQGAILAQFTGDGLRPAPGVQVTRDGAVRSADDYYFSTVVSRGVLLPSASTTNPNGAALLLNSELLVHGGTGGEPFGCPWEEKLAATIPGVLWVVPFAFGCPI